jgi:predicted lipoprotein with Yx(FWY)xxD motif
MTGAWRISRRTSGRAAAGVFAGVAMLALAACGSTGSTATSGTKAPGATSPATSTGGVTTSAPSGSPVVMTASNSKLGTILVDTTGKTLYTLTSGGKAVACTGPCTTAWPPLLLAGGATTATGASGVTGLGTTMITGGEQVTQNGIPLFRFAGDANAGDANGEGISSFGGTWHAATASGAASGSAVTSPPAATGAPTTTSGYGY